MHGFMLLMFSLAGGLTLSGIVANFYRMVAKKPQSPAATRRLLRCDGGGRPKRAV